MCSIYFVVVYFVFDLYNNTDLSDGSVFSSRRDLLVGDSFNVVVL